MISDLVKTFTASVCTDAADLTVELRGTLDNVLGVDLRDQRVLEQGWVLQQ